MSINGRTKVYGIIGNPVSHALSPAMQNGAFEALDENRVYLPFPVKDVQAALTGLRGLGLCGASVTIPHKEEVLQYLDEVAPVAGRIGAVNTIIVKEEKGRKWLCGSNTDWQGANRALMQKVELAGKSIVLLGAGGSARAIGFGLQEAGATVCLCSRTESRGRGLAEDLGCPWVSLREVAGLQGDVLVNATSVGMRPHEDRSPVAMEVLHNYHVVMDIVYAPLETRLLKEARQVGCEVINGLEMLLYQGVAQFELWTGQKGPVEVMRRVLYSQTGNFK